ncbi:MAG: sensor histidine kinase [Ruminococcus sp.]|nr:sensor histidine kinase [Ruminococcus sp.]
MNLNDYLRDNTADIFITIIIWLSMMVFFICFHFSSDIILLLSIIYFSGSAVRITVGFFRKKKFYDELDSALENLDKKYLLSEVLEEPSFLEGQIIKNALYESGKAMNENVDSYRKCSEDFREFIEMWVHEVKLPVASLLLMSHNDGENGAKYGEQLRRIDSYIENVLYYSRSESAEKDYIIKPVLLKRAFGNVAVKNREELLQMNVSLNTENLGETVMTDGKWLEFILGQLMSNSMKYFSQEREPEIHVYTESTAESVSLHFKDNGIGISSADLPYIFDKSYTGENGRTHSRSTGMGLYIVKSLCERLGHTVSAESVCGEYTDIIITFGKNDYAKPK